MAPEAKPETDRALEDIRREVIESRNLVIKTDNLLKNLHAELKMVGKRQDDFQKRQWLSSAVAYLVFAVMAIGAALVVSSARSASAGADKGRLQSQVTDLTSQLEKARAEANAEAAASRSAAEVYRLMTALPGDERLKGLDALAKLDIARLRPLERQALTDRAEVLRREVGASAFERGKAAFHRQDYPAAVTDLGRFMAMTPPANEALDASFFLGAALLQTRKPDQAVPHLARFVAEDRRSKNRAYAMMLLSQAYEATGQFQKAADVAREALGTYPNSELMNQLKARLSAAKRGLAGSAEPAPVGVAAPPTHSPAAAGPAPAIARPDGGAAAIGAPSRQPLRPAGATTPQ